MARTGRPPVPNEVKRRRGTARPDRVPPLANVTALPMLSSPLEPPDDLGVEGRKLWQRAWAEAVTWISPASDLEQVSDACRLADDLAVARRRYHATTEPADARVVVALSKQFTEALSALGFTPTARTRLGLAEVKKADAIDQILSRRSAAH